MTATPATRTAKSGIITRDAFPRAARRIAIKTATTNNAASAPATGAGNTSGVESSPSIKVLLIVGIVCDFTKALLDFCSRYFYHVGPLFDVLAEIGVEFLRGFDQRNRTLLKPRFLHLRLVDHFVDVAVEEGNNLLRRAFGRHDAKPDRGFITGNGFADCRQIGRKFRTLGTRGCKRTHLSTLGQRSHRGYRVEHHLNSTRYYAVSRVTGCLVRDMDDVGMTHGLKQFTGHMIRRARPGRCII